ncbi:HAD domain-containing protein [Sphingobacterium sp. lm-10]|uniref:HAD domain-containing protein n=1 Tax=Sphingobacterium sp. lm-10 TaxID=2944904 RepID=UPI002020A9B6|nr:HAD domain-containing protein [Sphingobacterium sp. lm-10]MCL7986731.1 HAD domain-containing protein [Sphingobacterium sp. lm-10]
MIFFLDIDGVMVHANPHKRVELEADGFYRFNAIAVEILNSIIYKTKDKVVLSTSHRFKYDIEQWKAIFESRGLDLNFLSIIDNDNFLTNHRLTRKTEILDWIDRHDMEIKDVVIIDDDKSLNDLPKEFKERLVLTNPYTGLNVETYLNLKNVIKRPVKKRLSMLGKKPKHI